MDAAESRVRSGRSFAFRFLASATYRWFALVFALVAALAAALPARAQSSVVFTTPYNVSQDSTAYQPRMAVDPAGNVFIAYVDTGSVFDEDTIWVAHGTSSGGSFQPSGAPVELSSNAGPGGFAFTANLSIAVESTCVIDVAYGSPGDPIAPSDLFVVRSTDCGSTFSLPANVTNQMPGYLFPSTPQLLVSNGTVGIVWGATNSPSSVSYTIFYAQQNSASSFTAPTALLTTGNGQSGGLNCFTALVIPGTGATAVGWCGDDNGASPGSVWFLPSVTGSQPIQIGAGNSALFAVDQASNVYVSWRDSTNGSEFSHSAGPSGPFSPPVLLSASSPEGAGIIGMAAHGDGDVDLLLMQSGGGLDHEGNSYETGTLVFSRSTDSGNTFPTPVPIASYTSSLPGEGTFVETAMAIHENGVADVAFEVESDWSSPQYPQGLSVARSNDQGTAFSSPVNIVDNWCLIYGCLQMATDHTDHVLLAWQLDMDGSVLITEGTAPADFTISAAPGMPSLLPGGAANETLTLTATGGFSDTVSLSCSNLPAGASCAFSSPSVAFNGATAQAALTLTTAPTLAAGNYSAIVNASGGGVTQTQSVPFTVGGVTGSISPSSATIAAGSSANVAVGLQATAGFAGQVTLACSGAPSGMACSFNPAQVTLAANGTAASALTVSVAAAPAASALPRAPWLPPHSRGWLFAALALASLAIAAGIVTILSGPAKLRPKNLSGRFTLPRQSPARQLLLGTASFAAALVLAIALISCSGATKTSTNGDTGAAASGTGSTGSTGSTGASGSGSTGTTGGTGTSGSGGSSGSGSGSGSSGSGSSGSGASGSGSSSGSGTSSTGSGSVTTPITVQAQSGGATVNLGTLSVTTP